MIIHSGWVDKKSAIMLAKYQQKFMTLTWINICVFNNEEVINLIDNADVVISIKTVLNVFVNQLLKNLLHIETCEKIYQFRVGSSKDAVAWVEAILDTRNKYLNVLGYPLKKFLFEQGADLEIGSSSSLNSTASNEDKWTFVPTPKSSTSTAKSFSHQILCNIKEIANNSIVNSIVDTMIAGDKVRDIQQEMDALLTERQVAAIYKYSIASLANIDIHLFYAMHYYRFENVLLNQVTTTNQLNVDSNIGKHIMNAFFLCLPHASALFPDAQSDKASINSTAKLVMRVRVIGSCSY